MFSSQPLFLPCELFAKENDFFIDSHHGVAWSMWSSFEMVKCEVVWRLHAQQILWIRQLTDSSFPRTSHQCLYIKSIKLSLKCKIKRYGVFQRRSKFPDFMNHRRWSKWSEKCKSSFFCISATFLSTTPNLYYFLYKLFCVNTSLLRRRPPNQQNYCRVKTLA